MLMAGIKTGSCWCWQGMSGTTRLIDLLNWNSLNSLRCSFCQADGWSGAAGRGGDVDLMAVGGGVKPTPCHGLELDASQSTSGFYPSWVAGSLGLVPWSHSSIGDSECTWQSTGRKARVMRESGESDIVTAVDQFCSFFSLNSNLSALNNPWRQGKE